MKNIFRLFLSTLLLSIVLSSPAFSKETQGRLGLGYNSEFGNASNASNIPAVSIKYALTRDLAASLVAGVVGSSSMSSVIAVKGYKNLFLEKNLNFYFTFGLGIVNAEGSRGTEVITGFGSEFFFPGLESLGFSFETGVSFNNLSGSFKIRTIGMSFLNAGIHFYF